MGAPEFLVVGCSYKTAPLELRETLMFAPEQILEALRVARDENVLHETMILSTCNRTEFYSLSADTVRAEAYVRDLISRFKGGDLLGSGPYSYAYRDRETVRHLLRVASGLDSMVMGEVQIISQVKEAYNLACQGGAAGVFLNRLLSAALKTGKRARTETEIGAGPISFASAAVSLSTRIFSDLADKRILLVGAGESGRLAAQHFAEEHPAGLLVANRTPARAAALAAELGGETVPFDDLYAPLLRADIVVTATRAPHSLITEDLVRRAMRARSGRTLVFVDMAMPRDVDPAVARLDNVFLYSLDALQTIMDQSLARRRRETPRVESIVEQEVDRFFKWTRALEVTPIVRELREMFETVRAAELKRHLHLIPPDHRDHVDALTRALVNKLLHMPTTRIKEIDVDSDDGLVRLDAVRELFDLRGSEDAAAGNDPGAGDEDPAASGDSVGGGDTTSPIRPTVGRGARRVTGLPGNEGGKA